MTSCPYRRRPNESPGETHSYCEPLAPARLPPQPQGLTEHAMHHARPPRLKFTTEQTPLHRGDPERPQSNEAEKVHTRMATASASVYRSPATLSPAQLNCKITTDGWMIVSIARGSLGSRGGGQL